MVNISKEAMKKQGENRPIVCTICGNKTWSDFGFMQHLIKQHDFLEVEFSKAADKKVRGK